MICFLVVRGSEGDYAVAKIPRELLRNANVVKRFEEEQFILKNPGEAIYRWKYALTILNENADVYSHFYQYYDRFVGIRSIDAFLYDAAGKEIKKLKSKDLRDITGGDESTLIDDTRFKAHDFYYKTYPYTIVYEVELKYNGTMFYPDWFPQPKSSMSVEQSRFVFTCPENYQFRYKAYQYNGEPVVTHGKDTKTYSWEINNLSAIVSEPFSQGIRRIAPLVLFGPTAFEMQDYKGSMQTWQDLGKFMYALKSGRDVLPDNVKQAVHQLTDKLSTPVDKIKALYGYLQNNTRYISIQLGIGGWQPFDAAFVAAKKYGDCKALSNYMYALLKEAGILSNYVLIKAGTNEEDIFTDFPSSQFNHVILCVPLATDTVWLECTDQFRATGYMGSFTSNRHALLVDEKGGQLIFTPVYNVSDNRQLRYIKASLGENGTLDANAKTTYSGLQQDELQYFINRLSKEKLQERLHEEFNFGTYDVNKFEYTEQKKTVPSIQEVLDITVSNYATITGKRLFIVPNIMTRSERKLSMDTARKYAIELRNPYRDIDSVEIELPKGFAPEAMPGDVSISSKFGNYSCSVRLLDNKLFYYRRLEHFSGNFPAGDYGEMVKFYSAVYKADQNRVVLVRN